MRQNTVNLQLQDTRLLIEAVVRTPDQRVAPDMAWTFQATDFWKLSFRIECPARLAKVEFASDAFCWLACGA